MKRGFLLAFVLALVAGTAGADFIRYHPPQFLTCASGAFCLPTGTTSIRISNGSAAEYGELAWDTNIFYLRTVANGGANRTIRIYPAGGYQWIFGTSTLTWDGSDAVTIGSPTVTLSHLYLSRSIQGSKSKTLTDAVAATAYATIAVPTNGQIAGELIWTATSSAAAVRFVANGSIRFWGVDEGGTPVCGINAIGTAGEGHSSGANTLVCTWSNVVATTNCAISVTCTNDTAGVDPITVYGRFNMPTTATMTFN